MNTVSHRNRKSVRRRAGFEVNLPGSFHLASVTASLPECTFVQFGAGEGVPPFNPCE